jgi:phosphoribosylamine--glycine ligase
VTGIGPTLIEARDRAYASVDLVSFEGVQFRRDIAAVAHA